MSYNISRYQPYFMWLFPLLFFTYQFILRLWPGLLMSSIMEQFSIDASSFGILAAFYYYGYAGMQIPVAILLERYSARHIIFSFALVCGIATFIFTYTNNFYLAVFSRFLIGAGSAAGFLGVSKVLSEWFAAQHYGKMVGYSFTIGLFGAIYGGAPLSALLEKYSEKNIALILSLISITIGILAYLFLRSPKKIIKEEKDSNYNVKSFKTVLFSGKIFGLALTNLLLVGSLEGFADIWGVTYLSTAFGIKKGEAAGLTSFIFFGMLIGGPLLAFLSKRLGNYIVTAACGLGLAMALFTLLLKQEYNYFFFSGLFFAIGILCCYQVIIFAAGATLTLPKNLGITVAFLNCMNMLGGSFFHTTIGKMLDYFWLGALSNDGTKVYNLIMFKYSLSIIPLCALVGTGVILLVALKNNKVS